MNRFACALIPVAFLTMGFSQQKVDASSGAAFHNSLQTMISSLEQARKGELLMAVFAVAHYHQCLAHGRDNGRASVEQHCGNMVPLTPSFYAQYYLDTGRMDKDVARIRTVWTIFGKGASTALGHSAEESWNIAARTANPYVHGKSGNALLDEYRSLVANERKEAMTQTEIDDAIDSVHELVSILKKQEDILASGGGSEADRTKCAGSIAWIKQEFVRVEQLKAGMRVPPSDRSAYGYQACNGIRKIR